MTHSLRFRSGQVQLRRFRVQAADEIVAGDLMVLDGAAVRPVSTVTWDGSAAATRQAASETFVGIAHEGSLPSEDRPISVDVSALSVYEVEVRPGTFEVGDLMGPDDVGTALDGHRMDVVSDPAEAIARAAEFTDSSVDRLRVTFASSLNTASANVSAQIG